MDEVFGNLDDLRMRLKCAISNLSVINGAIEGGTIAGVDDESDALFCVWCVLKRISDELSFQVDKGYEIRRAEKQA